MSALLDAVTAAAQRWSVAAIQRNAARRAEFYDVMADSAAQGIAQTEVLQQLRRHLGRSDGLGLIIERVMRRMRGAEASPTRGTQKTVGTELSGLLPDIEVAMIAAGELSGAVQQGWRNAAQYARRMQALKASVLGALGKPLFYLAAFVGLLVFFSYYLLPRFEQTRPRSQWPAMAQNLGWVADHVLWIIGAVAVALLALAAATAMLNRRWTGTMRDAADRRWPVFALLAKLNGAGFVLGLASFLASGVSFGEALQRLRATATPYLRWQITRIEQAMRTGARPEEALLQTSLVPKAYHWIVAVYGLVGAQDAARAYERIALEMASSAERNARQILGNMLGNAMLFALAGGIMVIYFSLMGIATAGMKL